ncbi:MAG TPA: PKD domain-containing protein [Solirubrobacterales bacterium]|nr:PKD domain-containing protein [Solirubrobacterales bacterium]
MSRRLPLLVLLLALLGSAFAASASGAARFYTPSYGWNDPAEPEVIGGFDLGADGSLAPVPGSPFPGEEPFREGGLWSLAFNPDGTRAVSGFYFNGGVQAYRVPAGGVFELTGATSTASATSVAFTPDGRFAYASTRNFNTPAEGIRRFAVNADGSLTPLSPAGGSGEYHDIAITPDGRFLFAATGSQVERFAIAPDGSLGSLGTTPAVGARSLAMAPDGRFLFARFSGGSSSGVISFAIGADGGLQQAGDPASIPDSFVRLFAVAPDGRHLYLADSNQNAVHVIGIAADGTPGVIGGMPIDRPESVGVSPDGRFLVYYRGGGSDDALGVASIGPDGIPTALGRELPWDTGEPERIVFQPHPAPVASFAVRAGAPGLVTQFDAGASARAAGYEWDFGDGTRLANGGPAPTHVYAKAGAYSVTLTVTDESGCSTRQIYNGQTTLCPGGSAPVATGTVDTLPLLGKPKAKPKKFRAKPKGKAKGKFGTTFRYTVNEAASVRFKFERKKVGRLVGKKCKPLTAKNAGRKKCPIFKRVGSRSQAAKAGANKLKWNGNLKGKPLAPGSYRATVVATDKAGGRSAPKTVGFRILPPQEP